MELSFDDLIIGLICLDQVHDYVWIMFSLSYFECLSSLSDKNWKALNYALSIPLPMVFRIS